MTDTGPSRHVDPGGDVGARKGVGVADQRGLIELVGDLAGAGFDLVQNTARLAACESRVVLRRLAVRTGLFFAFLVVAVTGLLLVLVGLALLLSLAIGIQWLSFVIVGLATLGFGAALAVHAIKRLGDRDMAFPATLAELERDVETLTGRGRRAERGEF